MWFVSFTDSIMFQKMAREERFSSPLSEQRCCCCRPPPPHFFSLLFLFFVHRHFLPHAESGFSFRFLAVVPVTQESGLTQQGSAESVCLWWGKVVFFSGDDGKVVDEHKGFSQCRENMEKTTQKIPTAPNKTVTAASTKSDRDKENGNLSLIEAHKNPCWFPHRGLETEVPECCRVTCCLVSRLPSM